MTGRCQTFNDAGRRCRLDAGHADTLHLFAGEPGSVAYDLGTLKAAVRMFLDGEIDIISLAETLARTEAP